MTPDLSAAAVAGFVTNRRAQAEPFRHVLSLGTNCYAAWLLKALGLRRAAYPFDWLFSAPEMVIDMLEDRFRCFLDAREHEPAAGGADVGWPRGRCHHRAYRRRFGIDHVFNHHDPTRPETAGHFDRAARRFLHVTGGADKVLLLMVNTRGRILPPAFERLCRAVDGLGPRNTLLAIDVGCAGDVLRMGMGEPLQLGRHRRLTYRSTSEMDGVTFTNPLDDLVLRAAVMQYRLALVD